MKKSILIVFAALLLQACSHTYVASDYEIREEHVPAFDVNGDVTVQGGYEEATPVQMRNNISGDLKQISDQMASQLQEEIRTRGGANGPAKQITVRVTDMDVANRMVYMEGRINVELALGNGETVSFEKRKGRPGVIDSVLDGAIGQAVLEALSNEEVQAYLAE